MRKHFLILGLFGAALALTLGARAGSNEGSTTTTITKTREGSGRATGPPSFTLNQAILTALRQNPDVLRAILEIERLDRSESSQLQRFLVDRRNARSHCSGDHRITGLTSEGYGIKIQFRGRDQQ
jgi:hypothetical protein